MNRIDLHTHTTASDGSLTPTQLLRLADNIGLSHIAITDHDTVDGLAEADEAAKHLKINFIPGTELSVDVEDDSIHLLGYGLDYNSKQLRTTLTRLRNSRDDRNLRIVGKLNRLGYSLNINDVIKVATGNSVGRGHIARALIESGQIETVQMAFDRLLDRSAPAYCDRFRLNIYEACDLIHNAGGIAVWAHPGLHGKKLNRLLGLLPEWVNGGLDGIETDYSQHSISQRDLLREVARSHDLIYTGGSDFHGKLKPHIQLGDGPEKKPIEPSIIEMINRKLMRMRT